MKVVSHDENPFVWRTEPEKFEDYVRGALDALVSLRGDPEVLVLLASDPADHGRHVYHRLAQPLAVIGPYCVRIVSQMNIPPALGLDRDQFVALRVAHRDAGLPHHAIGFDDVARILILLGRSKTVKV